MHRSLTADGRTIGIQTQGRVARLTTASHVNDLTLRQLDELIDHLADARQALAQHAAEYYAAEVARTRPLMAAADAKPKAALNAAWVQAHGCAA